MTPTQENLLVSANKARSWALICYALYGLGMALFFSLFVAIALNYWLKPQAKDSVVESHISWQIRTFWFTSGLMIIGVATAYINVGYLFIFAGALTLCLRTIWGAIQLYRYRPV